MGIGDWGLGPIPNPQSPIPIPKTNKKYKDNIITFTILMYTKLMYTKLM